VQSAAVQEEIARELAHTDLGAGVMFKLKGEDEERAKAVGVPAQGVRHRDSSSSSRSCSRNSTS